MNERDVQEGKAMATGNNEERSASQSVESILNPGTFFIP